MTNLVHLPERAKPRFVLLDGLDAARRFPKIQRAVLIALASATDPSGAVAMTIAELERRTDYARGAMLLAVRKLVADGILERHPSCPWMFTWDIARMRGFAEEVRAEDSQLSGASVHAKPNSLDRYRYVWIAAYLDSRQADRRYRVPGAAMVGPEPRDRGWSIIEEFGSAILAELPTTLEAIADLTCRKYFALDKPELVKAKHPLSFLPREIQDELQRPVWFALKRTNRPTNDARPLSAPSASSSPPSYGARELLAGLPAAPRFAAAGGAS